MGRFRKPALKAFEACPNNTFRNSILNPLVQKVEVVCPQYPFGSKDIVTEWASSIGNPEYRNSIAMKLGCATCRFKDELLERVDTQRLAPDGAMEVEVRFIIPDQEEATRET